jgi:hypothetical protein
MSSGKGELVDCERCRRRVQLLGFCGVTAVALTTAILAVGRLGVGAGLLLVLLAAIPAAVRVRKFALDGPGLYAIVTAASFGFASLAWLVSPPAAGPSLERNDIRAALILVAAGMGVFYLGARVAGGPANPSRPHAATAFPPALLYVGAYAICAAGLITALATGNYGYLRKSTAAAEFAMVISLIGVVAPVVILAAALAWLQSNDRRYGWTVAALLAPQALVGLVAGVKGESVLPFLLFALAFLAAGRTLPWRAIGVAGALIMFVLLPANEAYRGALRDVGEVRPLRDVADPAVYRPDTTIRNALRYPFVRFRHVDNVALIMRDTPRVYAYGEGTRYVLLPPIVAVPRFAWEGKPVMDTAAQFARTYWEVPPSIRTSQPVTQVGDLYRNFSWPGVLIGLGVWGALIGAWSRWWASRRSPRFDAVYIWSIPFAVAYVESDLPTLVATFAKALPLVAATAWVLLPGRRGEAGYTILARLIRGRPSVGTATRA